MAFTAAHIAGEVIMTNPFDRRLTSWRAKLEPKQIRELRRLRKKGWSQRQLAEKYEVSQTTISQILRKAIYRRVV